MSKQEASEAAADFPPTVAELCVGTTGSISLISLVVVV